MPACIPKMRIVTLSKLFLKKICIATLISMPKFNDRYLLKTAGKDLPMEHFIKSFYFILNLFPLQQRTPLVLPAKAIPECYENNFMHHLKALQKTACRKIT